ncbi:hypothetical protein F3F47_17150 [Escherichia coli]|nr:hypothetical protein [Escherichia coli]EFB2669921.1 hypothetical protein [Escherichia coli]EFD4867015.1 hypothetical protein [Escherichia coli]EFE6101212.1 hypothetical protein [Escherichia coli]EFH5864165.1 hypothetical protein [Escherichia coli]
MFKESEFTRLSNIFYQLVYFNIELDLFIFVRIRTNKPGYFITEHIAPFYERRWGSFLRDFKQNRII